MSRTRAVLTDSDRRTVSDTNFDAQVFLEETAQILAERAVKAQRQAARHRHAQERITASELRAEREAWDGESCRRQFERRSQVAA